MDVSWEGEGLRETFLVTKSICESSLSLGPEHWPNVKDFGGQIQSLVPKLKPEYSHVYDLCF